MKPILTVNLDAIGENYEAIKSVAHGAKVAPVVKADAYGLGAAEVAAKLAALGCREFYVSTVAEGIALRARLPGVAIDLLDGAGGGEFDELARYDLTPVINSAEQLDEWVSRRPVNGSAILNVETGFNRLGLSIGELASLDTAALRRHNIAAIMTHFACAGDDLADPHVQRQNALQLENLKRISERFAGMPVSVGLDAVVALGDKLGPVAQVRSGAALYGVQVFPYAMPRLAPVMSITAPVLQVKDVPAGECVGYGATFTAPKNMRVATLGIGYANGIPRSLGGVGSAWFHDGGKSYRAPIVGRISMGLITCDITDVPVGVVGSSAYLLDESYTINDMCRDSGRLDTEIMTNLKLATTYRGR
ncbi:MAG: alanine racemase [Rickettsiales bacterium]|jgi:alanine racemase|nr:alanine racemase [Rickettsiales bacterium]